VQIDCRDIGILRCAQDDNKLRSDDKKNYDTAGGGICGWIGSPFPLSSCGLSSSKATFNICAAVMGMTKRHPIAPRPAITTRNLGRMRAMVSMYEEYALEMGVFQMKGCRRKPVSRF
jgi:hypothetical protein